MASVAFNAEALMALPFAVAQKWPVLIVFLGIISWTEGLSAKVDDAVNNARAEISYAKEFDGLFPGAVGFISYSSGEKGHTTWNSKVGLFGRYVLSMQIRVTMDSGRTHVTAHEDPKFYLVEVAEIQKLPDGRVSISYGDTRLDFLKDKWALVVKQKGDLAALGIKVIKDKPIEGFSTHWEKA